MVWVTGLASPVTDKYIGRVPTHLVVHNFVDPTHLVVHSAVLPTHLVVHNLVDPTHLVVHSAVLPTHLVVHNFVDPTHLVVHSAVLPTHLVVHNLVDPTHLVVHSAVLPTHLAVHSLVDPTHLVVDIVVERGDDRFLMTHDAILDLRLHVQHGDLVVEGDEEPIPVLALSVLSLIKEQSAGHWKDTSQSTVFEQAEVGGGGGEAHSACIHNKKV